MYDDAESQKKNVAISVFGRAAEDLQHGQRIEGLLVENPFLEAEQE
jgi:hypothetical protein